MKTPALRVFIAILFMTGLSAATKAQSSMENWTELKNFHQVMAQTFHPMEKGDYKPIREQSGEMAEKARLLADSKIPAEFNKPEMVQAIQEVNAGSRKLDAMIKNKATDEEINKSLTALHEAFHKIVGLCQPGEGHEKHGDDNTNNKH
jgi:hypothetical protein